MSQFLRHESCPKCCSADNLARYDDGHGWCFGCNYHEYGKTLIIPQNEPKVQTYSGNNLQLPPDDATSSLGLSSLQWLAKYGIMSSESKDFLWSEEKQWLIYPIYSARALREHNEKVLVAWQARNFHPVRFKPRYISRGPIGNCFYIIGPDTGETLYLVEDMISAVKVGRQYSAFCLFGSQIRLQMLTSLLARFKQIGVWLDMDKAQESLKTCSRASQLGFKRVFSILTPKDPKEYTNDEIKAIVTENAT